MTDPVVQRGRGVLDTNTVIMLSRVTDAAWLPAEPLITAVTLAELSVGPLVASTDAERPRARRTSSRPRPTSIRCRLTPQPHGPLVESPHRYVAPVGR